MATSFYQVKNNAKTTITNNPLSAGGLSITLASSTGSKFPTTGNTWLGTIWDAVTYSDPSDDPNMEIVLIDSRSTDTLTVNASGRGFAGTTGVSHATGSAFRLLFTKEHADQWSTAINTLEAASVGTYTATTTWSPIITPEAGMTWSLTSTRNAVYVQIGKLVMYSFGVIGTMGGVAKPSVTFVPPITPAAGWLSSGGQWIMKAGVVDNLGGFAPAKVIDAGSATSFYIYRDDLGNFTNLGSSYIITASGWYLAA